MRAAAIVAVSVSVSAVSKAMAADVTTTKPAKKATSTTRTTVMTLNQAQSLEEVELSTGCSPPTILGGMGYCGPDYCGEDCVIVFFNSIIPF